MAQKETGEDEIDICHHRHEKEEKVTTILIDFVEEKKRKRIKLFFAGS
jgi:hypothetical protein